MTDVPGPVLAMVARYRREAAVLQSAAYGEADTRKEFVEPLFTALGWDVANNAHNAEAYKDIVNEYSLKVGGTVKAPDYAFRIGGTRTFFVEAKRPGVDIVKDPAPAFQLRRYGWTAKLPVSVLINFRHIAVYDCGRRPSENDKPALARTLLVPWQELPERYHELADLLGKTSVLQGSLVVTPPGPPGDVGRPRSTTSSSSRWSSGEASSPATSRSGTRRWECPNSTRPCSRRSTDWSSCASPRTGASSPMQR